MILDLGWIKISYDRRNIFYLYWNQTQKSDGYRNEYNAQSINPGILSFY